MTKCVQSVDNLILFITVRRPHNSTNGDIVEAAANLLHSVSVIDWHHDIHWHNQHLRCVTFPVMCFTELSLG